MTPTSQPPSEPEQAPDNSHMHAASAAPPETHESRPSAASSEYLTSRERVAVPSQASATAYMQCPSQQSCTGRGPPVHQRDVRRCLPQCDVVCQQALAKRHPVESPRGLRARILPPPRRRRTLHAILQDVQEVRPIHPASPVLLLQALPTTLEIWREAKAGRPCRFSRARFKVLLVLCQIRLSTRHLLQQPHRLATSSVRERIHVCSLL